MKVISASVLIDICKAISEDEIAMHEAEKQMIAISMPFTILMSKILVSLGDSEVRQWALIEITGVEYDSNDNK